MRNLKVDAEELARREARARRFKKEKELDPEGKTVFAPPKRVFAHPDKLIAKNKEEATRKFLERSHKHKTIINENNNLQRVNHVKSRTNVMQQQKQQTKTSSDLHEEEAANISNKNMVRKLKKKLRQIEELEAKMEDMTLNEDQKTKLASKSEIQKQLILLSKGE